MLHTYSILKTDTVCYCFACKRNKRGKIGSGGKCSDFPWLFYDIVKFLLMSIKDSMAKSTSQGNKRQVSEATMHYPSELCEGPRSASQFVCSACNFEYSLVLTSWFLFAATVMGHSWFDSLWPSSSSSFIINFHCRIYFLLLGFYIHLLSSL